jgi:hypothetical protein
MNDQSNLDPNVKLPAQVQAAADRANEIAAQMRGAPPPSPTPRMPQAGPPVTMISDMNTGPPNFEGDNWEHKFNSMKGRYDADQIRMRQQTQQISELQRLLAMTASPPTVPPQPQFQQSQHNSAPNPDTRFGGGQPYVAPKLISEDEEKEYGKDVLDVMGRRTMEIVGPDIQRLMQAVSGLIADNAQLKAQLGGMRNVATQDASGRFYDILEKEIPDWEVTNHDPEFVRWLGVVDPYSGRVRKDLLDEAHRQNEASRVLKIIKGYRAEQAAVNPAGNLQPTPGNGSGSYRPQPSPQFELQSLAAPGRAKSGQPPMPLDKPFFTHADISQFYSDVTKGKFEGRGADKAALEQALFSAAREGRIR